MIKNLVFDYGGVVINVDKRLIKQAFLDLKVSWLRQILHRKTIRHMMDEFICGLRPTDELIREAHQLCANGVPLEKFYEVVMLLTGDISVDRLEILKRLRTHYKVYLLSNINDVLWQTSVRQLKEADYEVEDCFDDVFLSFELKTAKPDLGIYEHLIQATGLSPAETLYFDDKKENIKAGRHAGFLSSYVKPNHIEDNRDYKALLAELKKNN